MPGLKLEVDGTLDDQGRIVAKTITVDGDDLETAQMIEAGLHPTAQQVLANERSIASNKNNIATNQGNIENLQQRMAALEQNTAAREKQINQNMKDVEQYTRRFLALTDYDVKNQATVNFDVGSSNISENDQEELRNLAQSARTIPGGYIIEIIGYADASGSVAMNHELSEDRAKAVLSHLIQQCSVLPRHIVAPVALHGSIYAPVASNDTKRGKGRKSTRGKSKS